MAILISFAGLPGAGKTTIARALSVATGAVYLRVDEIDAAIWAIDPDRDIGAESYHIAAALAASNIGLGHTSLIDCVNPWALTRKIFADCAQQAQVRLLSVEIMCSDQTMHRQRLEDREMDVAGLRRPGWQTMATSNYTPWDNANVRIDTARTGVADAVNEILRYI